MSNEDVPAKPTPGRRSIKISDAEVPVLDPLHVAAVSADAIVEIREYSGIMALGFAEFHQDGSAPIEAVVCARLRMSMRGAAVLRDVLDTYLKGVAIPQHKAPPQADPKGTTH